MSMVGGLRASHRLRQRGIERVKGVHHTTIITWVRQVGELLPDADDPQGIPEFLLVCCTCSWSSWFWALNSSDYRSHCSTRPIKFATNRLTLSGAFSQSDWLTSSIEFGTFSTILLA